jgi:hypothetical protein
MRKLIAFCRLKPAGPHYERADSYQDPTGGGDRALGSFQLAMR